MSNIPNPADFFNQKVIQGKRYNVTALGAWDALDGTTLLATVFAPVLGEVLDSKNVDQEVAMFEKQNTFKEILTLVTGNLNKPEMKELVDKMLRGVTCEGEHIDVNAHFTGKVHELMELIIFAVEVNFKGFFTQGAMFQSLQEGLGMVKGALDSE